MAGNKDLVLYLKAKEYPKLCDMVTMCDIATNIAGELPYWEFKATRTPARISYQSKVFIVCGRYDIYCLP